MCLAVLKSVFVSSQTLAGHSVYKMFFVFEFFH